MNVTFGREQILEDGDIEIRDEDRTPCGSEVSELRRLTVGFGRRGRF